MQKISNSSKNLLNKKIGHKNKVEDDESLTDSCSDIYRVYSSSSLRNSVTDIRGILKKGILGSKPKYQRSASDGVGMAALLVRSMMTTPNLDSIVEAHDSPKSSPVKYDQPKSESLSNIPTNAFTFESNSFLKPNIGFTSAELKTSDSNLSSNFSASSCTSLSSSSENMEEEDLSESEATPNEIVMVDADTVSMVVKSVLAQEQTKNDWIEPISSTSSDADDGCQQPKDFKTDECYKIIRTGGTRMSKDDKGNFSESRLVEMDTNPEDLQKFLNTPNEDEGNWIQPGSTTGEPECIDKRKGSLFHELKENISEKFHHIQEHIHFPHHHESEIKHSHGLLSTAMDTILMEQANIVGASTSLNPVTTERKNLDNRRTSIESFKKRFGFSFHKRSTDGEKKLDMKEDSKLVETAMKTMLLETANLMEEAVVHPLNNPTEFSKETKKNFVHEKSDPPRKEYILSAPFISLTDLQKQPEIDDITGRTYGSVVEFGSIKESAQPFISLTNLDSHSGEQDQQTNTVCQSNHNAHIPELKLNKFLSYPKTGSLTNNNLEIARCDSNTSTNKAFLLAPAPIPADRSEVIISPNKPIGHIRAESTGAKMSQSPVKIVPAAAATTNTMSTTATTLGLSSNNKDPICRRSSDSDLSVTPKVLSRKRGSLTTNDRPAPALVRITGTTTLKTPLNQDNLDMLEYPFLTMSKYPVGFILHLGATVCARSVKLLERVPNPDEPETRDSWWTELRMEIRSHARALGCNVVLGYSEVTTISDEVCVLSATGTAAVINLQFTTGEIGLLNTNLPSKHPPLLSSNSKDGTNSSQERQDSEKDLFKTSKPAVLKDVGVAITTKTENDSDSTKESNVPVVLQTLPGCAMCHIPYNKSTVPFNVHMKKCGVCKRGRVPDVLLATIEIPESLQITGRGCFLQAQVCRTKKDLKSESNAKEISDGLPFLEYDLHRLLINKLKTKGMNAIFGLKATVAIGEKMMALIVTGTAVFLAALPAPTVPKIVAGNSWTNSEKLNELQKSLQDTFDRNQEIYQLKVFGEYDNNTKGPQSDTDDSDDETNEVDLTVGNKDTCVLEVDDIEDLEIISLLMEPCPPEGFHIVNTQTVPGLHDLEVIRNLQMFTQIWRAKLSLNQQGSNFPKHFQRLLQTIYFKLRTMIPCAICDLRFRLDLPESEEIQLLVTGMAVGLGEPSKLTKYKRKMAAQPQTKESRKIADDELIFSLEEEQISDLSQTQSLTFPVSTHHFTQTGSLKLKNKSPTRTRFNSARLSRHLPVRERYGVDITPLSYVPGGKIEKYLGNLNFFFIRESTSIRENGGVSGFVHSFITEMLAVVRAHVTALGGNALVSFYMTELILVDNPHKNQAQCLISVGGDVVFVSYYTDE